MKLRIRIIALLAMACFAFSPVGAQELVKQSHPRLLMDKKEFKQYCKQVKKGANEPLVLIHNICMEQADKYLNADPVIYKKDVSNKRILHRSQEALIRVFSEAYAYRFTGDKKYLRSAEEVILTVCAFPDWNHSHYLDVGEMAAAVSLGYDWLYSDLKPETRAKAVEALNKFAFDTSVGAGFYRATSNWNSVCNGGLVCAALATFESNPETSRRIINDAVKSNIPAMKNSYSPDGNYAEGPGYWNYGTVFEVFMLSLLDSCLGNDFGLSDIKGFMDTPKYILYSAGASDKWFNFSDNGEALGPRVAMWYFAAKANDPSVLYKELSLLKSGKYGYDRLMPLIAYFASKIDFKNVNPPAAKVYTGNGETPVILVRTGWNGSPADKSLGIKGGHAHTSHGHLDAGSFVYDAYGMRWAMDYGSQTYADVEAAFKTIGKDFWAMGQDSWRWKMFRYNNKQHNTLTVNDKDHNVDGRGTIEEVYSEGDKLGGKFDLTPVFGGDLASAKRTAVIVNNDYLQITDELTAPAKAAASIRWSLVTEAQPAVKADCIDLTQGGVTLKLQTAVTGKKGIKPRYRQWPSTAETYKSEVSEYDVFTEGVSVCGYELRIPAGQTVTLVTTLKKQ